MQKIESAFVILLADDEEPDCNRCDNYDCDYLCLNKCGAEHGWYGYGRTALEDYAVCGEMERGKINGIVAGTNIRRV